MFYCQKDTPFKNRKPQKPHLIAQHAPTYIAHIWKCPIPWEQRLFSLRSHGFSGPLHMSPVTGLHGYRDEFCGVFIWEISARSTGMNSRNTTKMVEHKLVLFATVIALWTLITLLIKLFRILLKWKYNVHTRPKLCHFGRYVVRAKLFCLKCLIPVTERLPTRSRSQKTEISVTGPARPLI